MQHIEAGIFSTSVVDKEIVVCALLAKDIGFSPMDYQFSLVDFLSILSPTYSASLNSTSL